MSGENPTFTVNSLDPPKCLTKQQLWNYWNGDVTEQLHMRDLIETIFCLHDEIAGNQLEAYVVVCSDETTALDVGEAVVTWRLPYGFELTQVYAELTAAQASGSTFTVDLNANGSSILSTLLTVDNTETDSATAALQPVILTSTLPSRARITIDITQVGDGTAKGLKVTFIGRQT